MARTFDAIYSQLGNAYDPTVGLIQQQIDQIPASVDAGIAASDAKLAQANDQILSGARQRGMGFSGIPVAEQAKYAATDYAPAIAKLKGDAQANKTSLLGSIYNINRDRTTQAQGILDNELNRDFQMQQLEEQKRQFNEQQAAARASSGLGAGAYLGGGGDAPTAPQPQAKPGGAMTQRADKGFNFTINGKGVSAAQYSQATGIPFRQLLQQMANDGDKGAKTALGFVGDDYKYDPRKMNAQNAALYNALTGGAGAGQAVLQKPKSNIFGQPGMPTWGYR